MKNENLEVLEMEKPNLVFNQAALNGNDMADDFFDDDLVELDFGGLESNNKKDVVNNVKKEEKPSTDFFQAIQTPVQNVENPTVVTSTSENEEDTGSSYSLSNFDVLYDSLYNDVVGANNLISDLIEKKSTLNKDEKLLDDVREKFEKEKADFEQYVEEQKKNIENEKAQAISAVEVKESHLKSKEARFNEDSEAKEKEFSLREQSLKLEREKIDTFKNSCDEKNKSELERIKFEQDKLNKEREQFEADKKMSLETIENGQRTLQMQQEQFAKYKELEQKKLDLEEKNLQQSCARFKELVSQFNSGFEQLPNNE